MKTRTTLMAFRSSANLRCKRPHGVRRTSTTTTPYVVVTSVRLHRNYNRFSNPRRARNTTQNISEWTDTVDGGNDHTCREMDGFIGRKVDISSFFFFLIFSKFTVIYGLFVVFHTIRGCIMEPLYHADFPFVPVPAARTRV